MALTFDSNMTDGMLVKLNRHQVSSYDNREAIDELDGLGNHRAWDRDDGLLDQLLHPAERAEC